MDKFDSDFLLGAATAAHQVEGNNIYSDYWAQEHMEFTSFAEPSGLAVDHYHRFEEDIKLMSAAGLNVHFTCNGGEMVCSACGTTIIVSDFGIQNWGGCQPISIPTMARLDTDSEIIISSKAIDYAVHMFEQWDSGDMSETFANFEGK